MSLAAAVGLLEDAGGGLDLAAVLRATASFRTDPAAEQDIRRGYTQAAIWLRVCLRNDGADDIERMLEIANSRLSSLQFHQPDGNGAYRTLVTGSVLSFDTRPYANHYFVFPIRLPARSEQVYYLRLESKNAVLIPVRLWSPAAFHAHERTEYIGHAWYFGMAFAMCLFNLLLYLVIRDRLYLLYVSFAACFALTIAADKGLLKEFVPLDAPLWSDVSNYIGFSLSLTLFFVFMREMLHIRQLAPKLDRLLAWMGGILLLSVAAIGIAPGVLVRQVIPLYAISILAVVGVALYGIHRGQRSAYFFVAAYAMLLLGGGMAVLRNLQLLPTNFITVNGMQLGSALEMLLLALALADRINQLRVEKSEARNETLLAKQRLVESLQESEKLLEARVAERTLELQSLNRKLEELSLTDGLTGIANRRRFDTVLAEEWSRAVRGGLPLAVALLDIDWFKRYNDHYGHQEGDACLRQVARVLKTQVCRAGDLVARYGGEEFVFVAPATEGEAARSIAERVRLALQALQLPHTRSDFGVVTVSIGVAVATPGKSDACTDAATLLRHADEALYRAKANGRNLTVLYDRPETPRPTASPGSGGVA